MRVLFELIRAEVFCATPSQTREHTSAALAASTQRNCRSRTHQVLLAASLGLVFVASAVHAQERTSTGSSPAASPVVAANYPSRTTGVLILGSDWLPLVSEPPLKTRFKHGFAPALTMGVAPATMVADYAGSHAMVQVEPGRPILCVCHLISIPGRPVLVRLQPKKNIRELDAGKLHIGAKVAEAQKTDLIAVNVSQPENTVWLIQPQPALPAGEYALMFGTQSFSVFPFSVAASETPAETEKKR